MKKLFITALLTLTASFAQAASPCGPFRVPIVVVGDSNGHAFATNANGCWVNMARPGRSVLDPINEQQLNSFAPGTPVLISLGQDDAAQDPKLIATRIDTLRQLADRKKLKWLWAMPNCVGNYNQARGLIEMTLDYEEIWDWPSCSGRYVQSINMDIEFEYLRRFR